MIFKFIKSNAFYFPKKKKRKIKALNFTFILVAAVRFNIHSHYGFITIDSNALSNREKSTSKIQIAGPDCWF